MAIKRGKIPACSVANGMKFPIKPPELNLTPLEERLVSPRLAFMQIREMPRGGQLSVRGNIVNVPADVNTTVKTLPRMLNDSETIPVKFKRKLSYKHHVTFEKVRPNKVLQAAKWLVTNSILFRNEGIEVNNMWSNTCKDTFEETGADNAIEDAHQNSHVADEQTGSEWTEDDNFEERPTGNLDTVLQPMDFREFNQILSLAPGEGNSPLGLFQDKHSEFLAFPSIYCGQTRPDNNKRLVPLHYSTICKWELRNVDRRVAMSIPNIFFKLKKLQIKQIQDKVSLAIRKCKTKGRKIAASEILSPGGIDKITKQDEGYRVLRTLRGSPPYWEQAKKDIFAMIRQLGIPTWFCSFSAAETKWKALLKCLNSLVNKKQASDEDIENMTWQEKCHLIKSDPVTCARYFECRVQAFLLHVLKHKSNPIGEIADYFYRVEFQQRGSPHIHMLIWVKHAPIFTENGNNTNVEHFIDRHVTCKKDGSIPDLVNYQTHRHARTCRKKGKAICRFNFPLPPMSMTSVLEPLDDESDKKNLQHLYRKMIDLLNKMDSSDEISLEEFLKKLEFTSETYILCVRSTLKKPTIFLKRSPNECRINNYNTTLLKCWKANMDIQFILDPYACVSYIVSYISKGQRGLSNLLYEACREAKSKDSNIKQQVRRVGNQFLTHVEVGAQEAAYLVIQMPLRRTSREVVFVDTNTADTRTVLLKSCSQLKQLPPNSTNIESDNSIKRYKRRPRGMQNYCYADFVSMFNVVIAKSEKKQYNHDGCELLETDYNHDEDDNMVTDVDSGVSDLSENLDALEGKNILVQENNDPGSEFIFGDGTIMRKRRMQKIIRYAKTSINVDRENHFRESLMLFTSWRKEEKELLNGCSTYEESYHKVEKSIHLNRKRYEKMTNDIDELIVQCNGDDCDNEVWDSVLPEVQHQENFDAEEGASRTSTYGCFNPGEGQQSGIQDYDIGQDLGIVYKQLNDQYLPKNEICDDVYRPMVQDLNEKQQQFFYHVLHWVKTKSEPLYTFLTGGAGVGKSVVLKTMYQALLKYYNCLAGVNPDDIKILLCAPTGKAAHNIGGNTIHSSFCIPVGKGFAYKPLDMQQLNVLRCRYHHLKIVFIDEISMVGKKMFNFINLRLQEITSCTQPFGGVSIIAVGDLFQLKPVMDSWIFQQCPSFCSDLQNIATNLWSDNFTVYELDKIMRQKDDLSFAELLNRLREGKYIQADINRLKTRLITEDCMDNYLSVYETPHLFTSRAEVELHNNLVLSRLPTSMKVMVEAIDNVSGDINKVLQQKIISKIPEDSAKTMGLNKVLLLGLGLPAELCLNIDVEDGMTNGTPCKIMKFDYRVENSSRCSIIWVEFEELTIGLQCRRKYQHLYNKEVNKNWTPVLETTRSFIIQHFKTYHIVRRQFPLQMAAAKTIHKAQGSTLHGAVVHFGHRKNDHIHYVGLSRVRNIASLRIIHLNENKISVSQAVTEEMLRLRNESSAVLCVPCLKSLTPTTCLKVCFLNCRSLHKHIHDLQQDKNLLYADMLAFCETRFMSTDNDDYHLPGFNQFRKDADMSRCTGSSLRPSHGMVIYHKVGLGDVSVFGTDISGIEVMIVKSESCINICFIYCPPKLATLLRMKNMLNQLEKMVCLKEPTLIMGDLNQNLFENKSLAEYLSQHYNFKQLIKSATTDYGSCLDHIYVNFVSPAIHHFGTLESYFSDHKPIFIALESFQY